MTGISDLTKAKLHREIDALILLEQCRYSGAVYMSGYILEIAIKIRLLKKFECNNLDELEKYLKTKNLISTYSTLFTHDFEFLLKLTGRFNTMMENVECFSNFSLVSKWKISWRYGNRFLKREDAADFINSIKTIAEWVENNT